MNTNDTPSPPAQPPTLPSGRFEGRSEFRQLVRDALAAAARDGWKEIILADATFEDWPLGERAVMDSLAAWSSSGRKCTLLAQRYDEVVRSHARFVAWRTRWSHIITAVACPSAEALDVPSAIWSPAWVLERRDLDHCNGYCGADAERRVQVRERLNEWLLKASPAFASSTLGL